VAHPYCTEREEALSAEAQFHPATVFDWKVHQALQAVIAPHKLTKVKLPRCTCCSAPTYNIQAHSALTFLTSV
jgi:hypothetical protein